MLENFQNLHLTISTQLENLVPFQSVNKLSACLVSFFPNYNVSLNDSTLSTRLKVHVQITGSDQVPEALSATLHHQIIYRLQNHSIDLPLSGCSSDSLLVVTNKEEDIPSIVQIPRRISREELTQLIPLEWITNYEKIIKIEDQYNHKKLPSGDLWIDR
ncbi:hypothetical protein QL285_015205 [Trifolium repens]|nr:hypothetical protein QL285_015205 [Trifolium repens]